MYIIRNKIRVICSNIRVGMEGGPSAIGGSIFHRGIYGPPGPYSPIEYGPRGIWTPGPYSGGSIFNMTPVYMFPNIEGAAALHTSSACGGKP